MPLRHSPADRIFALVSGLPPRRIQERLFVTIQAYIDDSQEEGQVLVLAGYIASVPQWLAFSKDWQELLDMRPRWDAFHMVEIAKSDDPARWERAGGSIAR